MATPRNDVYIYATWLAKLLAGTNSCEWAAWFKAHYANYERVPSGFDLAAWRRQHHALLLQVRRELFAYGGQTLLEEQCSFWLRGRSGIVLAGKPDLIHINGSTGVICDVKTGQPRESDRLQVMLYMWALPLARREFRDVVFEGMVVYRDQHVSIPAQAIDQQFGERLRTLIGRVGGDSAPVARPSRAECLFCDIAPTECTVRFSAADGDDVLADF